MISYSRRLFRKDPICGDYPTTMIVSQEESYSKDGRALKKSVYKTVDNAEFNSHFSPLDFKLENLMAVGAMMDNKRYTYSPSSLDMMDSVSQGFELIDDIYNMENNNNSEKID